MPTTTLAMIVSMLVMVGTFIWNVFFMGTKVGTVLQGQKQMGIDMGGLKEYVEKLEIRAERAEEKHDETHRGMYRQLGALEVKVAQNSRHRGE